MKFITRAMVHTSTVSPSAVSTMGRCRPAPTLFPVKASSRPETARARLIGMMGEASRYEPLVVLRVLVVEGGRSAKIPAGLRVREGAVK